jgi:hypothetical protein
MYVIKWQINNIRKNYKNEGIVPKSCHKRSEEEAKYYTPIAMMNIRPVSVTTDRQERLLFALLSSYKIFANVVKIINVLKWVMKSRRMRWVGHVARMGRRVVCIGFWWGNVRERDDWGDPGVNGRIVIG